MQHKIASKLALFLIMAMGTIYVTAPSLFAAVEVRDNGGLFQPATIEKVNAIVAEIHEKFGKDLAIETFATIPERLLPKFKADNKDVFYDNWIQDQARRAETNGVFILIVRNPGHVEIAAGNQTRLKAFTLKDRDELRDLMVKRFHAREFDEGIVEAANFVSSRMEKNLALPVPPAPPATQPAPPATLPATLPAGPPTPPTTRPHADKPAENPPSSQHSEKDGKPAPDGVQSNKN